MINLSFRNSIVLIMVEVTGNAPCSSLSNVFTWLSCEKKSAVNASTKRECDDGHTMVFTLFSSKKHKSYFRFDHL